MPDDHKSMLVEGSEVHVMRRSRHDKRGVLIGEVDSREKCSDKNSDEA